MVIDNTNMTQSDRARYIQRAKECEFEVISYYFETDLSNTLQRNAQREGKANIPEIGVRATYKKLQPPSLAEGFDQIFKLKIIGKGEFSIHPIMS